MHFKTLLISTLLSSIPVIRAATTLADVNAANQALANEASDNDGVVNSLSALNVVTKGNTVATELQTFTQNVDNAVENDKSAPKAKGDAEEQTVIDPFQNFCTNTAQYMADLTSKRTLLSAQRATILGALEALSADFNDLRTFIEGLLPDNDYKEEAATAAGDTAEKISQAIASYASTVV
ncbi:hypothetical protein BDR22DRAFT_374324 [Usnea florida]